MPFSMPPCHSVLDKKIIRTNYLAYMIKHATQNTINSPTEGWSINECGKMIIDYFEGDPFPRSITDITPEPDADEDLIDDSISSEDDESEDDVCEDDDD